MEGSSSPLLTRLNSSESESHMVGKNSPSIDDTIEQCLGGLGPAQLFQAILVSFAWFFDAQQTFINVFSDAQPSWHCIDPNEPACSSATTPCGLPNHSWAWTEPTKTSVVSEWGLICAGPLVAGLPASAFFSGCLIGGLLLATLADSSLGRKNLLILSCLSMSITGVLIAFSPNVWVYSALRFISGFWRATTGSCALVLSTEIIGKKWRGKVGFINFICSTTGFLSLPAIAYLCRGSSWRILYLWASIPGILYCILANFLVHESPRWLFVRGRKDEAIQTLKTMAKWNGKTLNSTLFSQVFVQEESWNVNIYSALKILLLKKWAFRRLSAVMVVACGIGLVYYGMPLGVGNLRFNIYLSVTLNAIAELPAAFLTLLLTERANRRTSMLVLTSVSGVCSILCVFLGGGEMKGLQLCMELVSFLTASVAFNVMMIYTLELFPTVVRNSALSMMRQALVFGAVFCPILVVAGRKDGLFSFGVFGLVIGSCGLFASCLPETRDGGICDTLEEEEYKERASGIGVTSNA